MGSRLIIDGNSVYEIDEECMKNAGNLQPGRGKSSRSRVKASQNRKQSGKSRRKKKEDEPS